MSIQCMVEIIPLISLCISISCGNILAIFLRVAWLGSFQIKESMVKGWANFTTQAFECNQIDGNHLYIMGINEQVLFVPGIGTCIKYERV